MNYCTKCESYYQKPGTCNCYAQPTYPGSIPWHPTSPTTPTITWGNPCIVTSGYVQVVHADEKVQWSYTG